ncbi:MAG: ribonuclease P protein component [Bacteroidales bacterium]|nr:ribonuclease P protein component [Bacteroidales bacterium]
MAAYTLDKKERLNSKKMIEQLFAGGNKSFPAFPLRVVYMPTEPVAGEPAASMLVSVSKKRFKRAVLRNRVKRQIREAYRKNKSLLTNTLDAQGKRLILAFIWLDNNLHASDEIEAKMKRMLIHIAEQVERMQEPEQ